MLNDEQIDLIYRVFTNQISEKDMVFLSEAVRDGTAEEEFMHLLVRSIVKPTDFQKEMFKVIRSIDSIVKYVDLDRLVMLPSMDRCLTVRQVLKLGVTHKNLREVNQDLFEGLSEREFNYYVNSNLDNWYYDVIIRNGGLLKEHLVNKLRGEN